MAFATDALARTTVNSIAVLKATSVGAYTGGEIKRVTGYYAANDGGGGTFRYNASSSATDNAGTIVAPNTGSGRWERIIEGGALSVDWFGAKGDATTDDAAAFNATIDAAKARVTSAIGARINLSAKRYRIVSALSSVSGDVMMQGVGRSSRMIWDTTSGAMISLSSQNNFMMRDLQLETTQSTATLMALDNTFSGFFENVWFIGTHTAGAPRPNQTGLTLRSNSGANRFVDCKFVQLGAAVKTNSALNDMVSCEFDGCQRGIWADDGTNFPGMVILDCSFGSAADDATTITNIQCDVDASMFWVQNCWMEAPQTNIIMGSSDGLHGPRHLTVRDTLLQCTRDNLIINNSFMTVLDNLDFMATPPTYPGTTKLYVNPSHALRGTATQLYSQNTFGEEIDYSIFPETWTYIGSVTKATPKIYLATSDTAIARNPIVGSQLDITGALRINGGTPIQLHLSGTTTWDPLSLATSAKASTTVTVTGAAVGDTVAVGFSTAVPAGMILSGSVTATNTVTVTLYNISATNPTDLASGTLRADVWQH